MFFDTLSENPQALIKILKTLDYTSLIDFFAIRNEFRSMLFDIACDLNLDVIEDTDTTCYYLARDDALQLAFE